MIAENSIRDKLNRFLKNEFSLDQFEDWLVQRSWNMHLDSEESAQKLASAIELRLAEHSSGHLDEPALREELRAFLTVSTTAVWFGEPVARVSQQPPNNVSVDSAPSQFQVVVQDPATARQEVAGFFDTSLAGAHA